MSDTKTKISELEAKVEGMQHQAKRLRGYLTKYEGLRVSVQAALDTQSSNIELRRQLLRAVAELGEPLRPDARAIAAAPELEDKSALVLYFGSDADREEFADVCKASMTGVRTVNIN